MIKSRTWLERPVVVLDVVLDVYNLPRLSRDLGQETRGESRAEISLPASASARMWLAHEKTALGAATGVPVDPRIPLAHFAF